MSITVFIDGAAGTTGLEISDRLADRPEFELVTLADADRKVVAARREALNDADFVILCLPDDAARKAVALIENDHSRVIDASSAHRVADGWVYGMAELEPTQHSLIAGAKRVANPGCWPTGFLALVRPLVRAGLIAVDWPLGYSGASGYSGGGKAMIAEFENADPAGHGATAYRAYGLTMRHKHLPEMQRHARIERPPLFQPAVARTYRGMLGEVALPLAAMSRRPGLAAIRNKLAEAYRASPLIRVADEGDGTAVHIEDDAGSDRLTIHVCGNPDLGQARLIATFDNLGKGAGGAAIQNLNIMAGLDQTAGLVL